MCRTTPRVRNLLEAARAEARRRGDGHLGTEHILLAMLGDQGGIAGRVLRERADPEGLRAGVDEALAPARAASGAEPDLPELATAERLPSAGVIGPYVELPAEDVNRALAFYRDVLGLRARSRSIGRHGGWARLSLGDARLSLRSHADGVRVGFEVIDVDEACAALVAAGGRVVDQADHLGRVVVADPEGIPLTLAPWWADPYAITEPAFLEVVEKALASRGALCVGLASFGGPDHTWFVVETMDRLRGVLARGQAPDRFTVSARPFRPVRGRADNPAVLSQALTLVRSRGWDGTLLATGVGEEGELADAEVVGRADEVREWFTEHAAGEVLFGPDPFWPRGGEIVAYVPDAGGTVVIGSY